jgi:Family of unknown function (DUF6603)
MANAAGTLETLALELGRALDPLKDLLEPQLFVRLGMELQREISGDAGLVGKLTAAAGKAGELGPTITALAAAIAANNTANIVSAGVPLIAKVAELVAALVEAGDALHQAANALPAADRAKYQDFAAKLATRILEFMLVGYLDSKMPALASSLAVLGLVDKEFKPAAGLEISRIPKRPIPRRVYLDRIPKLISHPDQYFQQTFKWGANDFDGTDLLRKVQGLIESLGVPAAIYERPALPPVLEAFVLSVSADNTVSPPGLRAEISLPVTVTVNQTVNFSDLWKGTVGVTGNAAAGLEVSVRPPFTVNARPPTGTANLEVRLGLKAEKTEADPIIILGVTGGTRLQARSIGGSLGVQANLSPAGGAVAPTVQLRIDDGKLVIDFSQGDGFIQTLTSGIRAEAGFGLVADWNPHDGVRLEGHGGVEMFIPLHLDLSVIVVNGIYVSIGFSAETPLQIGLASQLTANLGPLVAVVDRIGVQSNISFPESGGNLGLADIDFDFLPPRGVGLSLDTGVIKGGGFLYLDPDKGEYFGALELSFQGIIALKAIGIINTKLPDGSTGFALLILVTAEFTPIQLGFGFTLTGVGGLLGLNRTTDIETLKAGVRTGAVSSILFPQDIVANINRIISDLKSIFPIAEGHFLIGPMAQLGWGTPTLISLELGIIIDIPVPRIVILGVLRCVLPTEETAILRLQVNFAGGIDFDQGLIWFDATLFDSRILLFTLAGDMALRIGWKDPMFVVSVGGFHPAFREIPSDLTGMRRITLSLLSGDNPRLTSQLYFAITSNSVQSGARVELYAEACGFNVYGYLGYDLLVQFNPFYFIATLDAGLALRSGTDEIAGIHVHGELSGPTPWHVEGEAGITILFFEISVGFSVTWGEQGPSQPVEVEDVLALVRGAVDDKRNWRFDIPANANQSVSLRKLELAEDDIIVHPFGILSVSQKVVPLGLEINKFGNKRPAADTKFDLTYGGGAVQDVKEEFAIANFIQMSDSEKVARKSFEKMKSGLKLTPDDSTNHGFEIQKEVDYELSYVHRKKGLTIKAGVVKLFAGMFNILAAGNSITKNAYSVSKKAATCAPAKVEIPGESYIVANTSDLGLHAPGMVASSEAEAYGMAAAAIRANPALQGTIQVISSFEAN